MTLPDCMMPDGAAPCVGFRELEARADKAEAVLADTREHLLAEQKEVVAMVVDARESYRRAYDKARNERDDALAEVERLRAAMPCPQKLWALAAWIDARFPEDPCPEVQADLRSWAHKINAALLWPCGHEEPRL